MTIRIGEGDARMTTRTRRGWPRRSERASPGSRSRLERSPDAATLRADPARADDNFLEVATHTPRADDRPRARSLTPRCSSRSTRSSSWRSTRSSARGAAASRRCATGRPRRGARAEAARRDRRLHLGRPGRHHDGLDRHRRPRRARARRTCSSRVRRGRSATAWRSRSRVAIAYLIITSAHIVAGEIVPKLYAIDSAEGVARRVARPCAFFTASVRAVHRACSPASATGSCG